MKKQTLSIVAAILGSSVASLQAQVIISDNYEVNNSANYAVVNDGTPDGTVNFWYDYIAAGIPLAPHSTAGDLYGMRLTANDTAGVVDSWTVFNNTVVNALHYKLSVDIYMGFSGSGTTEYGQVGVGGNGTTFNSIFTPISGSGSFLAITGDGGSASDYRWYLDSANGGPTTVPGTDPSYLAGSANGSASLYQTLFPAPPSTVAGSPGNIWTTMEIEVNNGTITYSFDNGSGTTAVIQGTYTGSLDGLVSLGINDPFTSVDPGTVFTLYDNLKVEILPVPEPTTCALSVLGAVGLFLARRRIQKA